MSHSRKYLVSLAVLLASIMLMSSCLATPLQSVDQSLVGNWRGESTVRTPIAFTPDPQATDRHDETVQLTISIHDDASVTGSVGEAQLVDCELKSNRSELGRQLNVASDYIIMDGYLDGAIVPGDEETRKQFTIPFDIVDGQIRGSIMWVKDMKYPFPLMQVELSK